MTGFKHPRALLLSAFLLLACQAGGSGPQGPDLSLVGWISLSVDSVRLPDGGTTTLAVEAFSSDGNSLGTNFPTEWVITPDSLATVTSDGTLHSRRPGRGSVRATVGSASNTVPLNILPVPRGLEPISPTLDGRRPGEPAPYAVRVVDRHGLGVPDVPVSFLPDSSSGYVDPPLVASDSGGVAATVWTLSDTPGEQTVKVHLHSVDSILFTVVAIPDLDSLRVSKGENQNGEVGTPLPMPIEVTVRDLAGNPVPNVPVRWTPEEGSTSDSLSLTSPQGTAQTQWTLGPVPGAHHVTATVGEFAVTAAATAVAGAPATVDASPDSLSVLAGDSVLFRGFVWDQFGNPLPDSVLHWSFPSHTDSAAGVLREDGWFIAGYQAGTYRIVASAENVPEASDTSRVLVVSNGLPNAPPTAAFSHTCTELTCTFDAGPSSDSDGDLVSWRWSFPGGASASGPTSVFTFPRVGTFQVSLVVTDDRGAIGSTVGDVLVDPQGPPHVVYPGMDLAAIVAAHPPGTEFILKAGLHSDSRVTPRTGDRFVGEIGAVMDGGGTAEYAFYGTTGIDSVEIRGLEIRNYVPPATEGAVRAENTIAWVIVDNEIHSNTGGVRVGTRIRVEGNHIHHNQQLGVMGQADDILITGNEISYNNYAGAYDVFWAAGGVKITRSNDPIIRDNHVHHNTGPGIWLDIDDLRAVVEGNLVTDNSRAGIYHEISYDGVIRNNEVYRNGGSDQWFHTGGIVVAASRNVEVYGNTVADNVHGIIGTQQARGAGTHGAYRLENLWVHDNTISMTQGFTGVVRDQSVGNAVFDSRNNRFDRNAYTLGNNPTYFHWRKDELNEAGWQARGHDVNGSFSRP